MIGPCPPDYPVELLQFGAILNFGNFSPSLPYYLSLQVSYAYEALCLI